MADHFASQGYSLKKQTRWSNDKTITELGYRKILWFVSVSEDQLFASAELATDKSRYLAEPSPIIVNYGLHKNGEYLLVFFFHSGGGPEQGYECCFVDVTNRG